MTEMEGRGSLPVEAGFSTGVMEPTFYFRVYPEEPELEEVDSRTRVALNGGELRPLEEACPGGMGAGEWATPCMMVVGMGLGDRDDRTLDAPPRVTAEELPLPSRPVVEGALDTAEGGRLDYRFEPRF